MTATVTVWPHFRRVKHPPGTLVISTTHRDCVDLSPFALGPCKLWGKYSSMNMENAWQFSKVYPEAGHWRNGRPSFVWFMWAKRGWADQRAHRYPMGKGAIPAGSWWDGELLEYIEARKAIYAPLYAELVQRTPTFKRLVKEMKTRERIVLLDYDAYDHRAGGMTLTDVLNNPRQKMGHAFVLAMLLTNDAALSQLKIRG